LTEWNEFRALNLAQMRQAMLGNALVDLRNIYPEALAQEAGFVYYGLGRMAPQPPASRPHTEGPGGGKDTAIRQATT